MKKRNQTFLSGSLYSGILFYTIPIILTNILQLLFNAADMLIVGRFCGSISLAAVSATSSISNLFINLFIGLSVGVGVVVANALGSKRTDYVHKAVHATIPIAFVSGMILTIIGVVFAEDFLILMQTPESVRPLSTVYMRFYFGGMIFSMIYNFCAAILRAAGDTKGPLIYLTIAGIVNVALNIVFVTVFHMNVAGVALATSISQAIAAVLVIRALVKRTDACHLCLGKMRFYREPLLRMIRIGLPSGIQGSLFSISNVIIQTSVNSFGLETLMSGVGASSNIEGFVYAVVNSFPHAALNYIGQNSGANQYDRVKKTLRICLVYVFASVFILGLLATVFGRELLSLYIVDSSEAIEFGMIRLARICLPYFICGLMEVCTGALRGLGCAMVPMMISVLGICGMRILWIYTIFQIPQYHTPEILYLSYAITWTITFLAQYVAFKIVFKKRTT